jgi:hypothetical protein
MSEKLDCDVLIAGAGPTGMSAAIALTQAGYRVDLIDKHKNGLDFSRAILVNSQTLKLLKPYGLSDKIISHGRPFKSITIYGPSQTLIQGEIKHSDMDYIQPTALPQLETERCFTECLLEKGVTIKRPHELKAFRDKREYAESFISTPSGDQRVTSRYLLGADGFHSIVRQGLSIKYNQSASPIQMYSQDSVIDWSSKSDLTIWILDSGAAIAMKIGHNTVRFAATNFETFQALAVADKIEETTWESHFDVYFAQVDSYGCGNVWLAGDAAHVHSPVGGRGMNMGIADGLRFSQAVIDCEFNTYQRTCHNISQSWVTKNKLFTQIMSDKNFKGKIGRKAIRLIFILLSKIDPEHAAQRIFKTIAVG